METRRRGKTKPIRAAPRRRKPSPRRKGARQSRARGVPVQGNVHVAFPIFLSRQTHALNVRMLKWLRDLRRKEGSAMRELL